MAVHTQINNGGKFNDIMLTLSTIIVMYDQFSSTCHSSQYTCSLPPLVANQ